MFLTESNIWDLRGLKTNKQRHEHAIYMNMKFNLKSFFKSNNNNDFYFSIRPTTFLKGLVLHKTRLVKIK